MSSENAQTKTVKVIVMRHGKNFGYRLAGEGFAQVFEACEAIYAEMIGPTVFISSGLGHARQTALVAAASFAINPQYLVYAESCHFKWDYVMSHIGSLPPAGGRVADALKRSASAIKRTFWIA
ncbi:MAG: hypothetical protein UX10_C0026G0007 [Candidatus Magasanikbacteria bacterium GW2011_GWA2_45_39]|uniref:Phosphoglycerate mutase n=1 Tax=Candidatus Magasanikbacteria bacterium GW2011_GWA2_45_39 TaxID=1619041 RepID=A0A0G1MEL5_9BACT|nr:MAG: hypothetical protein UX10_C0026G0007 [Candidatus Magasanikbacteria bacterium GW2011_GWA2_45_39]HBW73864.1 hypothetical protein [Candidatus Magasanikbacteria bacterium]